MSVSTGLQFVIGANASQFLSSIARSQRAVAKFTKQMKGLAGIGAGLFAGIQVGRTLLYFDQLGEKAAAIRPAFERLNQPGLLDNLRSAVSGTVADLELMRQAVRASNFQIPLEQLAKFFKFAQIRAKETGESVQYLTESIISGIGRKAPLILDNLGISAVRMRQALKGVSTEAATIGDVAKAVAEVIDEDWLGGIPTLDKAATATERLSAEWLNFGEKVGTSTLETTTALKEEMIKLLKSMDEETIKKFGEGIKGLADVFLFLGKSIIATRQLMEDIGNFVPGKEFATNFFKSINDAVLELPGKVSEALTEVENKFKLGPEVSSPFKGLFGTKSDPFGRGLSKPSGVTDDLFSDTGLGIIRKKSQPGLAGARQILDDYTKLLKSLPLDQITPEKLRHLETLKQAVSDFEDALDPERALRRNFEAWKQTMGDISKTVSEQVAYLQSLRGKDGRFSKRGQDVLDKFLNSEGGDQLGISDSALTKQAESALERLHQSMLKGTGQKGKYNDLSGLSFGEINPLTNMKKLTKEALNLQNVVNSIANSFTNLFASIINGTADAGEALKGLVTQLLGSMLQSGVLGLFAGLLGGGGGFDPLYAAVGGGSQLIKGGNLKLASGFTRRGVNLRA